jgi:hypothetical protein
VDPGVRRAEGGAKIFGVFRVKNHDFAQKNHIFSNCGGRRENFWSISCEKSRFYAKKSYFFQFKGGGGAPSLDPPLGCTNKRNIKKIKTIHLEHMLYNYIFVYKSISFKNCKIVSPATFVNKLDKLLAL